MTDSKTGNKNIWTIPNILSLIRLLMIPFIIWLYLIEKKYLPVS